MAEQSSNIENNKVKTFYESIEKTTNLLTCFGIFNALIIYSTNEFVGGFLAVIFSSISIIILNETLNYYEINSIETIKMSLFKIGLSMVQFLMVIQVSLKYPVIAVLLSSVFFGWIISVAVRMIMKASFKPKWMKNNQSKTSLIRLAFVLIFGLLFYFIERPMTPFVIRCYKTIEAVNKFNFPTPNK